MYGRIIKLRYYILFVGNVPMRSGQFRGQQSLAHVEISIENDPLDTFPAKNNIKK